MQSSTVAAQQQVGKPKSLFRPESLARPPSLDGMVVLRQPVSVRVLVGATALLLLALIAFVFFATYARRQLAVGYIAPSTGLININAPVAGSIDALDVTEGQSVTQGQRLASLRQRRELGGATEVGAEVHHDLAQSLADLDRRAETEKSIGALTLDRLTTQSGAVRDHSTALRAKLKNAEARVQLAQARVDKYEALDKYVSKLALDTERGNLLDAISARDDLQAELQKAQSDASDLGLQLQQERARTDAALNDLSRQRTDLRQRLLETQAQSGAEVSAPFSGQVTALRVHQGQQVPAQSALLTLIPEGTDFIAELYLSSNAIAAVRVGQTVYLKYKAYPFEKYGSHRGRVTEISNATFDRRDLPLALAVADEPLYRVRVSIDAAPTKGGESRNGLLLRAGMLLDADIVLERRTLWRWLLKPIEDVAARF